MTEMLHEVIHETFEVTKRVDDERIRLTTGAGSHPPNTPAGYTLLIVGRAGRY
jgi:hypothetical protein